MNVLVVVLAAAAAPAAGCWWAWARRPAKEPYACFHCPRCRQKLRYRVSRAGGSGICPRCLKRCTYPPAPQHLAS
jgi:hypothetical protein